MSHLVIFLYLLDNETSYFVLGTIAFGFIVECYKLTKVVVFSVDSSFPFIHMQDKDAYKRSSTLEYDDMAMKYVGTFLWPIVISNTFVFVFFTNFFTSILCLFAFL